MSMKPNYRCKDITEYKTNGIIKLVMGPDPLTKWQRRRVNLNNVLLEWSDLILMVLFIEAMYFLWVV